MELLEKMFPIRCFPLYYLCKNPVQFVKGLPKMRTEFILKFCTLKALRIIKEEE